jgi:hypothetical protein
MTDANLQADAAAVERADQLILLTERLTELVAQSAQAFEARRPQDASGLVGETGRLANLYRHESTRIRGNPRVLAGLGLTQRTRLVRATEAFDAVLARQARAVEAAKTVTEGLVRTIAEEVASRRQKGASYGANATTATAPAATAITLNKRA